MKKLALLTILMCLVWALGVSAQSRDQLAPDGVPGQIYYAPFPLTITIDGDLSDWAGVPVVSLPDNPTPDRPGISFAAVADSENFYLMANVMDNNIVAGQHDTNYWNEDSVEFYINATGDYELRAYREGVAQVTVPTVNIGATAPILAGVRAEDVIANAQVMVVTTDTGYAIELALPLVTDVWAITPAHGSTLGYQVHLNSASTQDRDSKLIWSIYDTSDHSYQQPNLFGMLVFFEIGQTELPEIAGAEEEQVVQAYNLVHRGAATFTMTAPRGVSTPIPTIYATHNVEGKMTTNDWWSSLAWKRNGTASENMYPHPLAVRAEVDGLGLGYPNTAEITENQYAFPYAEDLRVGVTDLDLTFEDVRVADFSDWTVTVDWGDTLQATIGHGLPFVYFRKESGDALITFSGEPTIVSNANGAVQATINGHTYGIFGPTGSEWTVNGNQLQSTLTGAGYFSIAILPDDSAETFADFQAHAYVFVTGSHVDWDYDSASAQVTSTFTVETDVMEGSADQPLIALYRHQWLHSDAVNTDYAYVSSRGEMKVLRGSIFSTVLPFTGVLPALPDMGAVDQTTLYNYIDEIYQMETANRLHLPGPEGQMDTYWTGKGLGRLAALVPLADQVGHIEARDAFLTDLKATLEDWFTVADGDTTSLFYYDMNWGALIGYPAANYGYDVSLNDHHFHNGYFIMAASTIAQYDPAWVAADQWGGMVNLLIEDANSPEASQLFPRLRSFDPYAGHSWAAGEAPFAAGNNQESSSEAMNFATAVILWGETTGNTAMRDLGVFLYASEAEAINQYWFDVNDSVFPADFAHNAVGIVWSNGGAYGTWWTADPEAIHAINFLPINGGSLYLGQHPDYIQSNYDHMVSLVGGPERSFNDIIWAALSMSNPQAALDGFGDGSTEPEWGETRAHIYHWLNTLNALGHVDATTTADIPTYAVFTKDGTTTYVAYNGTEEARTVHFSDGFTLEVPAQSMTTGTR